MRGLRAMMVVVLAVLAGGCGDDGSTGAGAGATTTPTVTPPTVTATVPATTGTTGTDTGTTGTSATTGTPAPQTERERIGDCLKAAGFRLQGGAPQTHDSASPDYQIIFSGPRGGGYVGFYKNQSRALRVSKQLRRNAQRTTGAAVERHGAINIVWVDLPDSAARARVRGCLVT